MAVFFLLVGLEVKQEVLQGHLSSLQQVALPGIAALGGMTVPALIYVGFNFSEPFAMQGWAIPTATDIALHLVSCHCWGEGFRRHGKYSLWRWRLLMISVPSLLSLFLLPPIYLWCRWR